MKRIKLFEKPIFLATKRTGLGLFLSYDIIKPYNSKINGDKKK
jgi:hypothetical protein